MSLSHAHLINLETMIKNKNKRRRTSGYKPVTTTSKQRKRKKHDFVSKGQNDNINLTGMEMESDAVKQRSYLYYVGIAFGFVLLILGVKDPNMMVEFWEIKYSGSLIGGLIIFVCVIAMMRNKPKVTIEK